MATNTINLLYAPAYVSSSWGATVVGATAGTLVKQISLVNIGSTSETVEVAIHTVAPTASERSIYKVVLAPGESAHFDGTLVVPTTYELYARTTTASTVTISAHGMDMT